LFILRFRVGTSDVHLAVAYSSNLNISDETFCNVITVEGNEAKATTGPGIDISHDLNVSNFSILLKVFAKIWLSQSIVEASNEDAVARDLRALKLLKLFWSSGLINSMICIWDELMRGRTLKTQLLIFVVKSILVCTLLSTLICIPIRLSTVVSLQFTLVQEWVGWLGPITHLNINITSEQNVRLARL
jgi:hypothetical protein